MHSQFTPVYFQPRSACIGSIDIFTDVKWNNVPEAMLYVPESMLYVPEAMLYMNGSVPKMINFFDILTFEIMYFTVPLNCIIDVIWIMFVATVFGSGIITLGKHQMHHLVHTNSNWLLAVVCHSVTTGHKRLLFATTPGAKWPFGLKRVHITLIKLKPYISADLLIGVWLNYL
jgi:hypothetical protein